jgi:hypothetical protein
MGYEAALKKAWDVLAELKPQGSISVKFLADEYSVGLKNRQALSLSCNIPAKDFSAILILHYLACKLKGLPPVAGEWLPFRELAGIEGYYPAFRKRSVEPIIAKYGKNPQGIFEAIGRLPAKKFNAADASGIVVEAFEGVPALVKLWAADDEFGPDANIFFDRSITGIFCTEDIVVLAGMIAGQL